MHGVTNLVEHPIQMAPPCIDTCTHQNLQTETGWISKD